MRDCCIYFMNSDEINILHDAWRWKTSEMPWNPLELLMRWVEILFAHRCVLAFYVSVLLESRSIF